MSNTHAEEMPLRTVSQVTRRHGQVFAKVWLADSLRSEGPTAAFDLTEVIEYPDEAEEDTPAKVRYESLFDEIVRRTFEALESPAADAFTRIASEVIGRERARQERMNERRLSHRET